VHCSTRSPPASPATPTPLARRVAALLHLVELLARTGDTARAAEVAAELRTHELDPASQATLTEIEASLQL